VLTADLTAVRENEPVQGMAPKKELKRLVKPMATSS
jgi:hypothetical protein